MLPLDVLVPFMVIHPQLGLFFVIIFPNGTAYDFTIPKGQFLVVTDVDWNYNTGEPNKLQTFSILMKMPKKEIRNVIFTSTIFGDTEWCWRIKRVNDNRTCNFRHEKPLNPILNPVGP